MVLIYKFFLKFSQTLINILFFLQITLMILVFLTSAYWFFSLINSDIFMFAEPVANCMSDIIKLFYNQDVVIAGVTVDGSLLLFDILALTLVFLITKSKYYVYKFEDILYANIQEYHRKSEEVFNQKLLDEAKDSIKKFNKAAILVNFQVESYYSGEYWEKPDENNAKEKVNEALKILYAALKNFKNCKFAKTNDKMLILTDFDNNIDSIIKIFDLTVDRIKHNMKQKNLCLKSYAAIDVYNDTINFKKDVYSGLEKLLLLKHCDEIVCFGNFCLRHKLQEETLYDFVAKGCYEINDGADVWALVKKNLQNS